MPGFKFSALVSAVLFLSLNADSQTYTTGRENARSEVNFTDIANYCKEHPSPQYRKPIFDEDEDEDNRPERVTPDPSQVHLIQRSAARVTSGGPLLPVSPAPLDTFLSTTTDGTAIPPDTHGDVDGTYCITAINTTVHIQTRTGTNVSNVPIDSWWTSVLPHGPGAFDPRVHYDPHYKRWIMVADAYGQTNHSQIMLAVSKTSNPTGSWYMYSVVTDPTGASWLDFPCVGFNKKWITVTGNFFRNTTGTGVQGAVVYVFNYDSVMNGTGAPYTKISESSSFTLCPAITYDTAQQSMFLLEMNSGSSGNLQMWKITGPVASPVIASIGFPATTQHWHNGGSSDFVPQAGTTNKLQAGDDRITRVMYRNNYLWCSHTVFLPDPGTASRCSVMWWQIDTAAHPIQNGLIDNPTVPNFFDYSSIAVNANNDVLVGFGYHGANMYPSAGYALHMHTDPADSMRPPVIFRHGKANYYQTFGGTQNRWGDYSSTCVDPTNNIDFWTIQESVPASPANFWDTWWAHVQLCPAVSSYTLSKDTVAKGFYDTITFNGTAPAGTAYTWSFGGGTATPGTGAGPQRVKWTTGGWHDITLTVTDSGCTATYTDSVYVKSNVGINDVQATAADITIVPNPNDGSFAIVSSVPLGKAVDIVVTDMQGRVVYTCMQVPALTNNIPVRTNDLPPGLYLAQVHTASGTITKKIVVMK